MKLKTLLIPTFALMTTFMACDQAPQVGENPFFTEWETPFGVPPFDQIKPEHYMPAFERALSLNDEEIDAIINNNDKPTFDNVILAYDNSGKMLTDVYNVFGMITAADTNDELQAINDKVMPMLSAQSDKISLNDKLFAKIKTIYDDRKALNLDAEQLRLVELTYNSFVRGGALLNDEDKGQLKEINDALSSATVSFGNNLLAENNNFHMELDEEDLVGLPNGIKAAAKAAAKEMGLDDKWVITLHYPSWIPFVTYSDKRDLREKLYKAYISRGNNDNEFDNKQLINDMVRLRAQKAKLLGFDNYADYVISDQMAKETKSVYSLLEEIWDPALEVAKEELAQMEKLLHKDDPTLTFESWDWWYYAEKLRKKNYDLDEEALRPYFSLANVQSGIFLLANRLYGITFRPIAVPHYNAECTAYEVIDVDNSHLGVLYFDFHSRPSKSQGAWCGNFREQRYEDGKRVSPVVSITCNFSRPQGSTPALLSIDETETLFHEFGHAMHFLLHDVKYRGLSEVEGDFVELPSQIMENWAFTPEMLESYAIHYRTNKPIPTSLINKIRKSTLFNQGFMTTELTAAALSDMDIHSIEEYKPFVVTEFEDSALITKRGLIPQIEPRYHYTYFAHIFAGGYSAGYYFYLWAEVLDQDAFAAFKESGDIFNKKLATSFRKNILERGGSEAGMDMYHKFRGTDPNKDAMLISRGLMEAPLERVDSLINRMGGAHLNGPRSKPDIINPKLKHNMGADSIDRKIGSKLKMTNKKTE